MRVSSPCRRLAQPVPRRTGMLAYWHTTRVSRKNIFVPLVTGTLA